MLHRVRLLGVRCRERRHARLERAHLEGTFVLDELETFETDRRLQPVTMAVLVHGPSFLVVHRVVAPLPARGRLGPRDLRRKAEFERLRGRRTSGSGGAVAEFLDVFGACLRPGSRVRTDPKATDRTILRDVLGLRAVHERTPGRCRRNRANPLFAVQHTFARVRDGVSRLVPRTWAHAKLRLRLAEHAGVWDAWRNCVRGITNVATRTTPAMAAGIESRPFEITDFVRCRARCPEVLRGQPAGPANGTSQRGQLPLGV